MARKTTIRSRMERIWKSTEMLNEVKVRKPYIKKVEVKRMQSEVYKKLYEENHRWLQSNIEPRKVVSITAVQKHMVETRA